MGLELAKAFIRVRGDSSKVPQDIKKAKGPSEGAASSLAGSINRILATIGAGVGFAKLLSLAKESIGLAKVQINAEQTLAGAIAVSGREVDAQLGRYKRFASEIQSLTVVGDEVSLGILQIAESMGIQGSAAENVVRNSIGLQAAFGINAKSAGRYAAALEQGDAMMLTRYIPTLKGIKDNSEKVALAQKILGDAFEVAKSQAGSLAGQNDQLKNTLGDVKEQIGKALLPAANAFLMLIIEFQEEIRDAVLAFSGWIVSIANFINKNKEVIATLVKVIAVIGGMKLGWVALMKVMSVASIAGVTSALAKLAIVGAVLVAQKFFAASQAVKEFNRSLEASGRLSSKLAKLVQKRRDAFIAKVGGTKLLDRPDLITKEIKRVKTELQGLEGQVKAAQNRIAARQKGRNIFQDASAFVFGDAVVDLEKTKLADAKKRLCVEEDFLVVLQNELLNAQKQIQLLGKQKEIVLDMERRLGEFLGVGRFGFEDLGRKAQDLLLKDPRKENDAKRLALEEAGVELLGGIKAKMDDFLKRVPVAGLLTN